MMFGSCRAIWVRASLVGVSVRSVVVQKKTDSMTEQEQLVCKMCNVKYDESSGRVHGGCHTCASADRALRRNLGDRSEVQEFSKAEAMEFFRKVKEAKEESPGKRLQWQTLLLVEPLLSSNEDADCLHKWKRTACRRRYLLSASQLFNWQLCHNLFVKQNALFASCSKTQLSLRKK